MRVQNINQSSIYQLKNRQNGSVSFSGGCRPREKWGMCKEEMSMPSFGRRVKSKHTKQLLKEMQDLVADTCKTVKESFNKSKTKKILVAPIQKKWSDFASKRPVAAQITKGAFYVSAGVTAFDAVADRVLD